MPRYYALPSGQMGEWPDNTPDEVIEKATGKKISAGAGIEEPAAPPVDDGTITIGGRKLTPLPGMRAPGPEGGVMGKLGGGSMPEVMSTAAGMVPAPPGVSSVLQGLFGGLGRAGQLAGEAIPKLNEIGWSGPRSSEGVAKGVGQDLLDVGATGLNTAATSFGLNKGLAKGAPLAQKLADKSMKAALKIDRGFLEKMAGARSKGINAMEREVLDTAFRQNVNPTTRAGENTIQDAIDQVADSRMADIRAAPQVPIANQARDMARSARRVANRVSRGPAPQDDIATMQRFSDDLQASPKMSAPTQVGTKTEQVASPVYGPDDKQIMRTVQTPIIEPRLIDQAPVPLAEAVEAGNVRLKGAFAGSMKDPEVVGRRAVQKAMTRSLDRAAGTKAKSKELKDLINLREVSQISRRRAGATNPIGITDIISLSSGHPGVALASAGMKAPVQGAAALKLNKLSKGMETPSMGASSDMQRLLRAIASSLSAGLFSDSTRSVIRPED